MGNSTEKKYIFLIYFFWPFAALILAIKNYKSSWSKNVVWLFVAFFGYVMVPIGDAFDATREKLALIELHQQQLSFSEMKSTLFSEDSNEVDIVDPIIHYVVSRFTDNCHILFCIYGIIFGFFYSRNIWILINKVSDIKGISIFVILTFACIVGYWYINGFRFWTATHVFLYGSLLYILEQKKRGLIFIALSPFVHFSFFMPALLFIVYLFAGERTYLFFILFALSFFIKTLNIESLGNFLTDHSPAVFHNKINNYTDQEYVEIVKDKNESTAWHVVFSNLFVTWTIVAFISLSFFFSLNKIRENKELLSLYSFGLLFGSVANISALIPSGGRFLYLSNLLFIGFIFLHLYHIQLKSYFLLWRKVAMFTFFFFIIFQIRISFDLEGLMTFFGNPILASFFEDTFALITPIKALF